mgnify:CR=1 FL=1
MALYVNSELNKLVVNQHRLSDSSEELEDIVIDAFGEYCARHSIESIDILNIDVQRWELEVMAGAERMVSSRRIRETLENQRL